MRNIGRLSIWPCNVSSGNTLCNCVQLSSPIRCQMFGTIINLRLLCNIIGACLSVEDVLCLPFHASMCVRCFIRICFERIFRNKRQCLQLCFVGEEAFNVYDWCDNGSVGSVIVFCAGSSWHGSAMVNSFGKFLTGKLM